MNVPVVLHRFIVLVVKFKSHSAVSSLCNKHFLEAGIVEGGLCLDSCDVRGLCLKASL